MLIFLGVSHQPSGSTHFVDPITTYTDGNIEKSQIKNKIHNHLNGDLLYRKQNSIVNIKLTKATESLEKPSEQSRLEEERY